jgi:hypothetical protein
MLRLLKLIFAAACGVVLSTMLCTLPAEAAGPPRIDATWVTGVSATAANLRTEIDPEGSFTTYHFFYVSEALYRENLRQGREGFSGAAKAPPGADPSLGSGSTDQPALQQLGGLEPEATYRYRVVATSSAAPGGVVGPERLFTTQGLGGGTLLLDRRAWELVSPIEKDGGAVQGVAQNFGGDILQAAADGDAVTYSSSSSFGQEATGAPGASQYLSRRGEAGWSTEDVTVPLLSGSYGDRPDGVPYQLFSTDLSSGLVLNGDHCRGSGGRCAVPNPPLPGTDAPAGYQNYYLRDDEDNGFKAVVTEANSELALTSSQFDLAFAGASPDLRHVVLSTCAALTLEATEVAGTEGCNPAETNLYEWSGGELSLINGPVNHHAQLAAQAGAISADGRRVYFTAGEDSPILLREEGQPTKVIEKTIGGAGAFQTASADGSLAFFTLGGDLYRYDALTETTSEPLATGVQGVLGASEDGSHLYYATASGLFLWDAGATTEVAPGAEAVASGDYPPTTGTARVSPGGAHLAFLSKAELTGYENVDARSGAPDTEAYVYTAPTAGAEGMLLCASCNPTGERPLGSSSIPGAIPNGEGALATDSYKPRDLSANGARLFFDSSDALVLQDTDNAPDVYEWEAQGEGTCQRHGGCVNLISSGTAAEGASFVDASASGADAFFLTGASLVSSDSGSVDLYDAREGGGFPEVPAPIACDGDSCQSLPPEPEDPSPNTLLPSSGNPPLPKPSTCKAGFVKTHGKCARKPMHHKHNHRQRRGGRK